MTCTIDATEFARLIDSSSDLIILDLLLPEQYAAHHIPGAVNACLFEPDFFSEVAKLIPDKSTPVVVYDSNSRSQASTCAARNLERDGYRDVRDFSEGLDGWISAGYPLEPKGTEKEEASPLPDKKYRIDPGKSHIIWTGRSPIGGHTGDIGISYGELIIEGGQLAGGRIIIDMRSITNSDLQQSDYRNQLISHLLSQDFFDVSHYPTAQAVLKGWSAIPGSTPGRPNYTIDGELTIKGITHPVSFGAVIAPQADCVKAHALLDIDRTRWDITYGAEWLPQKLGIHLVNNIVTLEFMLIAC